MEISRELNEPLLGEEPYRYEAKITNCLEIIDKMHPVEFFYLKKAKKNSRAVGINIQDENVPRKYVYQKDTAQFLSADYLNSILIGAVQDQQKSIEKLEEKVKKLEHFIFSHKTMTPSLL
jgi:hypothetical protein